MYQHSDSLQTFNGNYENGAITCNGVEDCEIICDGTEDCRNTFIQCPTDYSCDITCSATKSCALATINATYSSSLAINNCADGSYTCKGITVYAPPNVGGQKRFTLEGDNGLGSGGPNEFLDGEAAAPLQFYAIYGWDDIDLTGYSGSFQYGFAGTMYCTVGYQSSCSFASAAWTCANTGDLCNDPPTPSPTNELRTLISKQTICP